jgi:hypothetical protein
MGFNEHHGTAFVIALFFLWMTHNPIGAIIAAFGGYYGAKRFGDKLGGSKKEKKEEEK